MNISKYVLVCIIFLSFSLLFLIFHINPILAQSPTQLPSGLISYWPADGDAQDIVGPNEGTLLNGTTFATGKLGQAFSFDGVDDVIDLGSNNIISSGNDPFSTTMWIYPTKIPSGWFYFTVRLKQDTQFLIAFTNYYQGDGSYVVSSFRGATHAWKTPVDLFLLLNRWTHVTTVYNGGDKSSATSYAIYLNGIQLPLGTYDSGPVGGTCNDNTLGSDAGNFCIGDCSSGNSHFQGLIDEVQIYSHILTQNEIQMIINHAGGIEPIPCVQPPSGIVSWWPGDGDASDIVGQNTGTLQGGATFTPGVVGQAFHFDGTDDNVIVPNPSDVPLGNSPRSVEFWVNVERLINNYQVMFAYGPNTYGQLYATGVDAYSQRLYVGQGGNAVSGSIPSLNTWIHFASTHDGLTHRVYENGNLIVSGTMPTDTHLDKLTIGSQLWYFGALCGLNSNCPFKGMIDEATIYNRTLTQAEIQGIYGAGIAGKCKSTSNEFNTPQGTNVFVQPQDQSTGGTPVTVTYATVTESGNTSLITSSTGQPPPPSGFKLGTPPTYYNLQTTATFTQALVCIDYTGSSLDTNNQKEENLKLYHLVDGVWTDQTYSLDTANNEICAQVTSFSPFAIFEPNYSLELSQITAPLDPVLINTAVQTNVTFTDLNESDIHTAVWEWGDGNTSPGTISEANGSGNVTDSHTYTSQGVYTVKVTVTDNGGASGESLFYFIVIYNPDGGFVTGGGWIDSPSGAYTYNPSLTGKAKFGFVSKYQQGVSIPTGQTEFQFMVADLNFHSTDYQWFVVAGAQAKFKGEGIVSGSTHNYGFLLSATDGIINGGGGVDKFRIKIWDIDNSGTVVYDNQLSAGDNADPTTEITGGNIVIH